MGHATVAAHAVLLALGRRGAGVCRQHCGYRHHRGQRPNRTSARPARKSVIEFRQTVPELDAPLPFKTTLRVAEALQLPATQLHDVMPARIARKGSSRLLVPIADPRHLEQLSRRISTRCWRSARELGTEGFFVFAVNRDSDETVDRIAHVLPRARHPGGPGQRQRACHAGGVSLGSRPVRQEIHDLHRPAGLPDEAAGTGQRAPRNRQGQPWSRRTSRGTATIISEGTLAL